MLRLFIVSPKDAILVRLAYSVTFHGKLLMDTSLLGIALHDQDVFLGETVGLVSATPASVERSPATVTIRSSRNIFRMVRWDGA